METHVYNESFRRFEPKKKVCLFCKTKALNSSMEDNCFSSVYNIQNRTNIVVYRNVKFNEVKIGIPRCSKCCSVHSMAKISSYVTVFVGVLLVFIIPIYLAVQFDLGTIGMIFLVILMFGLVYLAVLAVEKAILSTYDVISEKDGAMKEPLVREFLRNGWSLDRPTA